MRAELQGFKSVDIKAVAVRLGQTTDISLKMEVGGLTETVQVTSSAAVVDTGSTTGGRGPLERDVREDPDRPSHDRHAVSRARRQQHARPAARTRRCPASSGLDNLYVVDGVNVTNTGYGAVGSYSIIFGSLGTATPFDFVKEVQVKTGGYEAEFGQSMGGVVNVVTKSGSNTLRGSVFGYCRPSALEADYKTVQTVNGTVNTRRPAGERPRRRGGRAHRARPAVLLRRDQPVVAERARSSRRRTSRTSRCASLGEIDRERRTLSYSAKATWQAAAAHRMDVSFFGDPSKGEMGPQRTSSLTVHGHLVVQRARLRRPQPDASATTASSGRSLLVEASFARAYNKIAELPSVDAWRVTDHDRSVPNIITGGIGGYEQGNVSENFQYTGKATYHRRRPRVEGRVPATRTSTTRRSTSAPARRSPRATDGRRVPAHRSRSCPTSTSAGSTA